MSTSALSSNKEFAQRMQRYQQLINDDITAYAAYLQQSSDDQFGVASKDVTAAFLRVLTGPGKRIRGILTLVGYEMCGGTNQAMIIQAARAMEMVHCSLLIFDDIQDRSPVRRGQPAAHLQLGKVFGDEHLGEGLAINAGLLGSYAAEMILANLDVEPELRANVVSITNRTLLTTIHGQNADQLSNHLAAASPEQISIWKTANYSVLNPLHVGMVLAGADCHHTDAITPFALEAGQAFQIANDIRGVFGRDDQEASPDDIREGKRTLLTEFALEHASPQDQEFLQKALGDPDLTGADFKRCQKIMRSCGALQHAQQRAEMHAQQAIDSLDSAHQDWTKEGVDFLRTGVMYLLKSA